MIVPLKCGNRQAAKAVASNVDDTSVGLYSDRVCIVWIACLALTSQLFFQLWCPKLFGDVMCLYVAIDGELHPDDYTGMCPAADLLYTWKL